MPTKVAIFNLNLGEGLRETVSDLLWDKDAGPFENIFRWGDRALIFSGGGKAILLGSLYYLGIGLHDIGAIIDNKFGFKDISDVKTADPSAIADTVATTIWDKIENTTTSSAINNGILAFAAFTNDDKIKLLNEFDKAGISKSEFAKQKGIPISTFKGWLNARASGRLVGSKKELKFSPVEPPALSKKQKKERVPAKKKVKPQAPKPVRAPTIKDVEDISSNPTLLKMKPQVAPTPPAPPVEERRPTRIIKKEPDSKELTPWQKAQIDQREKEREFRREQKQREFDQRERENLRKQDEFGLKQNLDSSKEQFKRNEYLKRERQIEKERQLKERQTEKERRAREQQNESDRLKKEKLDRQERERATKVEDRRIKQQQKHMLALEKMRASGKRPSAGALRNIGGKAALAASLAGIISGTMKLISDPKSWLSRGLRGAGIIGAETIQRSPSESPQTRERSEQTMQEPQLNQAEQIIEQIFSL